MLVIGITGQVSEEIASRLRRHIIGAEFLLPSTTSYSHDVELMSIAYKAAEQEQSNGEAQTILLIGIDMPDKGDELYAPYQNFLDANSNRYILPFNIRSQSSETPYLSIGTTYSDFIDMVHELTGYSLKISGPVHNEPVYTHAVTENFDRWSNYMPKYRGFLNTEELDASGLGKGVVLVFTAVKGGSGKSSLSLLASNILTNWGADRSSKVLLIDANLGQPVIAGLTWETPRKDVRWAITQIEEGVSPDDVLLEVAHPIAADVSAGRRSLGSGGKINAIISTLVNAGPRISLRPEALYELVTAAARVYDYIIVDTPPIDATNSDMADKFVLPIADKLVFVCEAEFSSTKNTFLYYRSLVEETPELSDIIGFVLNKFQNKDEFTMDTLSSVAQELTSMLELGEGKPLMLGTVPFVPTMKSEFNAGANIVPEIPEINQPLAGILEKVLGEEEGTFLVKSSKARGGLFRKKAH